MPDEPGRIVVSGLTKTYGTFKAVDDLSFTVEPGSVTGFLGPNGAGKTTTLRMVLGLATPTAGKATIGGQNYAHIHDPGRLVGAVLEATSFHPGRSARNHLRVYCAAAGLPDSRADEVLDQVGLASAGRRNVRGYSLGMRQRLALATALLGDPQVLILDEPANGLDPEGIAWLRTLLRDLAEKDGRTVLVSSHMLSEVEQTVDRVVILSHGRLVREGTLADLVADHSPGVVVRTPTPDELTKALTPLGATLSPGSNGEFHVEGADLAAVGHEAWKAHVELHELSVAQSDLEQVFLQLTSGEHTASVPTTPAAATGGTAPAPATLGAPTTSTAPTSGGAQ